ncbi:DUF262 domain-containing protein [Leifsonia sp. YAF41]|uniref:GmrSD restriction endonuclease domain-containing protein n=1 Tax=Leifsonia sp. YAF41 TaxID=3233086 RepID=UPI003F957DD1
MQETRVRQILEGGKQYLVPLYQRPYAWEPKQRDRLWDDILKLADDRQTDPTASHFMGSLVLALGDVGPNGLQFLVVDGQQRLTTLSILLCALRDYVRDHNPGQPMLADQIHEQYIADRYKSGDDRLKLLPTQADRDNFRAVVDRASGADSRSGVGDAYRFFRRQLEIADDPDDPHDIQRIQDAVLDGLAFVSITAKDADNVYRIFESLNNTGLRLTQGDLLRNYLFMRLGRRGEDVYNSWWLPMQRRLSPSDLELLFWLDAVADAPTLKQAEIYTFQHARLQKLTAIEIEAEITRFEALSKLLMSMREPELEKDISVRLRLQRLKEWGTTTVDPVILRLLAMRDRDEATTLEVSKAMAIIESFLVRRVLVGGPGAGINRVLLQAGAELRPGVPVNRTMMEYLASGRKHYGSDERVRKAVLEQPLYLHGRANQQKLILKWLDESFGSKEAVDVSKATIEHVLPQTLTPGWRAALNECLGEGETVDEVHESLVHTLGNLTLTAYNSELSNREFSHKRDELRLSGIRLNSMIADEEVWGRQQILERGVELAERAILEWEAPAEALDLVDTGVQWSVAHEAVMAIPPGSWTSYGDLAALIGTHPVPMGQHLATVFIPGGWRVLQAAGTISPGFQWIDPKDRRDAKEVLELEGLRFDAMGRAEQSSRLHASALAAAIGIGAAADEVVASTGDEERFLSQLRENVDAAAVHGVIELLRSWEELGGEVTFGVADQVTAFLMGPEIPGHKRVWPFAIYPSGTVEVVFQHMAARHPFDSEGLREEFRTHLLGIRGIEITANKLMKRPTFPIEILGSKSARQEIQQALEWFVEQL